MNKHKNFRLTAIIAAALIFVLSFSTIATAADAKTKTTTSTEYTAKEIKSLNLEINATKVEFKKSDNGKIKAVFEATENVFKSYTLKTSQKENELTIKLDKKFEMFSPREQKTSLTIYLPDFKLDKLDAELNASSITMDDFNIGDLTLELNACSIEIGNIKSKTTKLDLNASSGKIKGADFTSGAEISANASSVDIELSKISGDYDIDCNASSMNVKLPSDADNYSVDISSSVGSITAPKDYTKTSNKTKTNETCTYKKGSGTNKIKIEANVSSVKIN